jgi:hypothetical protein
MTKLKIEADGEDARGGKEEWLKKMGVEGEKAK